MQPWGKIDVRTALQCLGAISGGALSGAVLAGGVGFLGLRVLGLCSAGDMGCGIAAWFVVAEATVAGALFGLTVGTCYAAEIVETRRSARFQTRVLAVVRRSLLGFISIAGLVWLVWRPPQGTRLGSIVVDLLIGAAAVCCGFFALRITTARVA